MANPFTGLLQKLGLKKSPEGVPPPQLASPEGAASNASGLPGVGDGKPYMAPGAQEGPANAPKVEGMVWKGTSFEGAPNVGLDGTVNSKEAAAPVTAEAPVGAAMGGGEAKG